MDRGRIRTATVFVGSSRGEGAADWEHYHLVTSPIGNLAATLPSSSPCTLNAASTKRVWFVFLDQPAPKTRNATSTADVSDNI